jgi:16S rRNA (guanine(966)-N(2))-methyltransferase RsmD
VTAPGIRISAGSLRGRRLATAPGMRPSGARLREALFSIWSDRIAGARFLDLFAGSGAVGLEALSRGAASATFVESDPGSLRALRENLRLAPSATRLLARPASEALDALAREAARFDLVFADPPYALGHLEGLGERVHRLLEPTGAWAFEHRTGTEPPAPGPAARCASTRRYGDSSLTLYEPG